MSHAPSDPQGPRSADKTQMLNPEALRAAQEGTKDLSQATVALPVGLPMLEPLPPLGEEPTQPLRITPPAGDAETEAMAIIGGPDATVRLTAGTPLPPPPPDPSATVAIPVGAPLGAGATQVLAAGTPEVPAAADQTHPEIRTVEIPPDQLPSAKRRMPLWVWGTLAILVLGSGLGSVYFLQPQWLGLKTSEAESEPPAEISAAPETKPAETPAPEIPQALRHYYEEAEKGDASAMRMLGVMYYNGLNVAKNEAEGLKWYRKAAEHGSKAAQKELKLLEKKVEPK